jgi:hypothetical protein
VVGDGTKSARLVCQSRPCGPWSHSPACFLLLPEPVVAVERTQFAPRAVATPLFTRRRPRCVGPRERTRSSFGGCPEAAEASALHLSHRGASFGIGRIPLKERRTPAFIEAMLSRMTALLRRAVP